MAFKDSDTPLGSTAWLEDVVKGSAAVALRMATAKLTSKNLFKTITVLKDPTAVRATKDIAEGQLSIQCRL